MIDNVKIYLKAGDGGSGCESFKCRKLGKPRYPDGGTGGRGADIIIRVDKNVQSLEYFQFKRHFHAEKGKIGRSNKKKGAEGHATIIKVPLGTTVRDVKNNLFLRDLVNPNDEFVVVRGGEGGKGNSKTRSATEGLPGEEKYLSLEFKLVSDIAIIGYPNTGKSTFLTQISLARPKIGVYPFTTVNVFLATQEFSDFQEPSKLTFVEIPGLVAGSNKGKGLGVDFLRHALRARILLHFIDISALDGIDPLDCYTNLNNELNLYDQGFSQKTQIIVANKIDLLRTKDTVDKFSAKIKQKVYPISAKENTGINSLIKCIRDYFQE